MTSRLWISEKPSAAADLAAGLCLAYGATSRKVEGGVIELSNGEKIVPLAGHVLTTAPVQTYLDEGAVAIERAYQYERFCEFLPVLPNRLQSVPRRDVDAKGKSGSKPFRPYEVAVRAIKSAKEIVNAGDTDREGQLIVDELLEHLGIDPYGARPLVWRFGIASNLPKDIADAVKAGLDRNGDPKWRLRSEAAKVRQHLDFCWGMNFSMANQARHRRPQSSVGRVQTPVLAMVDRRDREIAQFKPVNYFVPVITLKDGTKMRWFRRPGCEGMAGFDTTGRIINEAVAREIVGRINAGQAGRVSKVSMTQHSEKPPLPFSLGTLQSTASRELGLTVEQVGDAASSLYRRHKAISYIGTDCKFLPTSMHAQAPQVLRALGAVFPKLAPGADPSLKSPAFNDAKLDEHFAIVPTGQLPEGANSEEQGVFRIVARRFLAQFYPDFVYQCHKVEAAFGSDEFTADSRAILRKGWKEVEGEAQSDGDGDSGEIDRDKDQPSDEVIDIREARP
jgi:DNA topoisomerase-3